MLQLPVSREPNAETEVGGLYREQTWSVPTDEGFLQEFLSYIFSNYWNRIAFGPIMVGAVYELTCPSPPTTCQVYDGYLKVSFGGPHFHLCIGESKGHPNDPMSKSLKQRRLPSKARIFRRFDERGHPHWWGFEVWNGDGDPMLRIFFDSPFLENADILTKEPKWENLAMWRDISKRYLGREPEALDETGAVGVAPPPVQ